MEKVRKSETKLLCGKRFLLSFLFPVFLVHWYPRSINGHQLHSNRWGKSIVGVAITNVY